nr:MAG TPA: hypothetical protein [Caudoviricetes sp.]
MVCTAVLSDQRGLIAFMYSVLRHVIQPGDAHDELIRVIKIVPAEILFIRDFFQLPQHLGTQRLKVIHGSSPPSLFHNGKLCKRDICGSGADDPPIKLEGVGVAIAGDAAQHIGGDGHGSISSSGHGAPSFGQQHTVQIQADDDIARSGCQSLDVCPCLIEPGVVDFYRCLFRTEGDARIGEDGASQAQRCRSNGQCLRGGVVGLDGAFIVRIFHAGYHKIFLLSNQMPPQRLPWRLCAVKAK